LIPLPKKYRKRIHENQNRQQYDNRRCRNFMKSFLRTRDPIEDLNRQDGEGSQQAVRKKGK
jgi:hypothetical protein